MAVVVGRQYGRYGGRGGGFGVVEGCFRLGRILMKVTLVTAGVDILAFF